MSKPRIVVVAFAAIVWFLYANLGWFTLGPSAKAEAMPDQQYVATATFAGGCFWCMERPFDELNGVIKVESGYTGGHVDNPTYQQVVRTETGHVEAVRVTFDVRKITYSDLLEVFWRQIDPTDGGGQFVDRGASYLSAVFVSDEAQRMAAEDSKDRLVASGRFDKPIVTPIRDATEFFLAEDYHQDYYTKSPLRYKYYRYRSGRDAFLDSAWGEDRKFTPKRLVESGVFVKPSSAELQKKLTKIQFRVTQQDATEPAFRNEYWNNSAAGLYVDVVSGEPLFSSQDKYKSGTGWPSFSKPVDGHSIVEKTDYYLIWPRTEIRSKIADSHLGHVFNDGPAPTGLRYCLNSAALRFIPREQLKQEGYDEYAAIFEIESVERSSISGADSVVGEPESSNL